MGPREKAIIIKVNDFKKKGRWKKERIVCLKKFFKLDYDLFEDHIFVEESSSMITRHIDLFDLIIMMMILCFFQSIEIEYFFF